jgi:hypothetical protein
MDPSEEFLKNEQNLQKELRLMIKHLIDAPELANSDLEFFSVVCAETKKVKLKSPKIYRQMTLKIMELPDFEELFSSKVISKLDPPNFSIDFTSQNQIPLILIGISGFLTEILDQLLSLAPSLKNKINVESFVLEIKFQMGHFNELVEMPITPEEIRVKEDRVLLFSKLKNLAECHVTDSQQKPFLKEDGPKNIHKVPNVLNKKAQYREYSGSAGDIKEVCIYPRLEDLSTENLVYLNPLTRNTVFNSCDQYLESHFRLIREDFIQSLREGFKLYQKQLNTEAPVKNMNLTVFRNVRVIE